MTYFMSDYSQGAHPKVMEALERTNAEHTVGYGADRHCERAADMIKALIGKADCHVHMLVGGTSCNVVTIAAALKPYEAVVAPRTGHIYTHETGAVEATGHKIVAMDGVDGKLTPQLIDMAWAEHEDEHTVLPKMAYISQPTERGTVYTKAELTAIRNKCNERKMYLYIDGARLGAALTADGNDVAMSDLARLCDAFYIGGTKNGALFGEALVVLNDEINDHFRYMIKRQCGMLAKGRLIGVQFEALFDGGDRSVYFETAAHANKMAKFVRDELTAMGIEFLGKSTTNQIFPILPAPVIKQLEKDFAFHRWTPEHNGMLAVRLVTGWGTTQTDVDKFAQAIKKLCKK